MPTNNPRLNITIDPKTARVLAMLAEQEDQSVSSLAKELILEALEHREDLALAALAEFRDKKTTKKIKHVDQMRV